MLHIDSERGNIGNFWWINSQRMPTWIQQFPNSSNIRWGEFGFGSKPQKIVDIKYVLIPTKNEALSAYHTIATKLYSKNPKLHKEFEILKRFIDS